MDVVCPICNSNNTKQSAAYRGDHDCFKNMNLIYCQDCTLTFASPMPDMHELREFNHEYFHSAHGGKAKDTISKAFFSAIARIRVATISKYLGAAEGRVKRVLEFGPGDGYLANIWQEKHPQTTYLALETDKSCHSKLQDMNITLIDEDELDNLRNIDLIIMSHVLEHVTDPGEFLLKAFKTLNVGGAIFIEVPCLDFLHKNLDEPHLLFFDKKSMEVLLETTGFKTVYMGYYGNLINKLKCNSYFQNIFRRVRNKLISLGFVRLFLRDEPGLEIMQNDLERVAIIPHKAHIESKEPAWWLRAIAKKPEL